jgi:Ca-activated chloride channel homolog
MRYILTIIVLFSLLTSSFADGIIVPVQKDYPSEYLKNRVTEVEVVIYGVLAETVVYQEFVNEWIGTVDGVYSFPLPPDARATRLQYTLGDTLVDAILKVKQQSTNPGTGGGGVIAEINKYMGKNVLTLSLSKISPREIKGVRLSYISTINQYGGTYGYTYPLNTGKFVKHPLDHLTIDITVNTKGNITSYDIASHPGYRVVEEGSKHLKLEYLEQKAYVANDISFFYTCENRPMDIDLFTFRPEEGDGYFTLVGTPPIETADTSLSQNIIFLLGNSTTMIGNKLNQSKAAIHLALMHLSEKDSFNIFIVNANLDTWSNSIVPATPVNIQEAQAFVDEVEVASGNRIDNGILHALLDLRDSSVISSIVVFCDGRSPLDPFEIEKLNTAKTGIFFIALGDDVDRVRLDATAALNYGFVEYISREHILSTKMLEVFQRIKTPILKELDIGFDDPVVHSLYPEKFPAVYSGSDFVVSGRYQLSGLATILLNGTSFSGETMMQYQREFASNSEICKKLWAKQAIDALEANILIYGEDDTLKDSLIELSLEHNIRCRYTAFTEVDSIIEEHDDDVWDDGIISVDLHTGIIKEDQFSNYPNPFSDYTTFRFMVSINDLMKPRFIIIYDFTGKIIKSIDLSYYGEGVHEIQCHDIGASSSGIFFARMIVGQRSNSIIKIIKVVR